MKEKNPPMNGLTAITKKGLLRPIKGIGKNENIF